MKDEKKNQTLEDRDIEASRLSRRSALRLVGASAASATVLAAGLASSSGASAQHHGDPVNHGQHCSDSDPSDPAGHGHHCTDNDH